MEASKGDSGVLFLQRLDDWGHDYELGSQQSEANHREMGLFTAFLPASAGQEGTIYPQNCIALEVAGLH